MTGINLSVLWELFRGSFKCQEVETEVRGGMGKVRKKLAPGFEEWGLLYAVSLYLMSFGPLVIVVPLLFVKGPLPCFCMFI